jgi:hypothetical protein
VNHKEKIDKMIEELSEKNIKKRLSTPITHRILWYFDINVPPPLFSSFIFNFFFHFFYIVLICLLYDIVVFGLLELLIGHVSLEIFFRDILKILFFKKKGYIALGFLGSSFVSFYSVYIRGKYKLPLWENYK